MMKFIERKTEFAKLGVKFVVNIRLQPPAQNEFEVVDGFLPVDDKV